MDRTNEKIKEIEESISKKAKELDEIQKQISKIKQEQIIEELKKKVSGKLIKQYIAAGGDIKDINTVDMKKSFKLIITSQELKKIKNDIKLKFLKCDDDDFISRYPWFYFVAVPKKILEMEDEELLKFYKLPQVNEGELFIKMCISENHKTTYWLMYFLKEKICTINTRVIKGSHPTILMKLISCVLHKDAGEDIIAKKINIVLQYSMEPIDWSLTDKNKNDLKHYINRVEKQSLLWKNTNKKFVNQIKAIKNLDKNF